MRLLQALKYHRKAWFPVRFQNKPGIVNKKNNLDLIPGIFVQIEQKKKISEEDVAL